MDLEGIGALAAAGVAAIGIPAALLVGRWQTRAALRAAEETGRAGIAQAEATYRAAIDAVRAESSAAHAQWRRGVQRDAYAAFLLAAHQVTDAAERLEGDSDISVIAESTEAREADLANARTGLPTALLVVTLEGPAVVADAAQRMHMYARAIANVHERQAAIGRAWRTLVRMHENAVRLFTPDASRPDADPYGSLAHDLMEALAALAVAVRQHPYEGDYRHATEGVPTEVAEAGDAVRRAFDAFPLLTVDLEVRRVLLDEAYEGRPRDKPEYRYAVEGLEASRDEFVAGARTELDGPFSSIGTVGPRTPNG
ncbi:hypothetical protein ACGF0K_01035 [Streptomyces sp. NPDC048156]|uniref:hypothetical protein n=1 Tax=Streptomyces sp. NPDC048156 TaxID=3365502 RepID=UPI00371F3BC6